MMKGMKKGYDGRTRPVDAMGREGAPMTVVEFTPPAGLELDGVDGTAMVNWEMTPTGMLRITAIEGVSLAEAGASPTVESDEDDYEMEMDDEEGGVA